MIFQLEHTWSAGEDGAHYVSVMDTGARSALMSPINRIVSRRFPDVMVRVWFGTILKRSGSWNTCCRNSSQVKRNQRNAHRADTPPHAARTDRPNQSTDNDIACVSASLRATDGVSRAAHRTASGTA